MHDIIFSGVWSMEYESVLHTEYEGSCLHWRVRSKRQLSYLRVASLPSLLIRGRR